MATVRDDAEEVIDALLDECVAVAWVVVGDEDLARQVAAQVVLTTRGQWLEWREEAPVARMRGEVIAQALAAAPSPSADDVAATFPAVPHELESSSDPRDILRVALSDVGPAGRALLAVTTLQDGTEAEAYQRIQAAHGPIEPLDDVTRRVETAAHAARRYDGVDAIVRAAASGVSSVGVRELADSLRGNRVRRRLLVGGGLATVTVAGVAAVVSRMPPRGAASAPPSSAISTKPWGAGVDLTRLPPTPALAGLPDLPGGEADTAIPMTWGLGDLGEAALLSAIGTAPGAIRALFVYGDATHPVPVLHIPSHHPPYVVLDGILPESAEPKYLPWSPRLIDDDRRQVALLAPGSLTVIAPETGTVHRVELPRTDVIDGGWSASGQWFMVHVANQWLRIGPASGVVRPVGGAAGYGRKHIDVVGGTPTLYDLDGSGVVNAQREVPGSIDAVMSGTITNTEGWAATTAMLTLPLSGGRPHAAAYAVSWDVSARAALLVSDALGADSSVGPVIGWAPGDVALIPVSTPEVTRLVGWSVIDGSLWTVCRQIVGGLGGPWGPIPSMSP